MKTKGESCSKTYKMKKILTGFSIIDEKINFIAFIVVPQSLIPLETGNKVKLLLHIAVNDRLGSHRYFLFIIANALSPETGAFFNHC
ncbi:MAG: hypothetical protein H7844_13070 [Nitrospirae bacterium YQR-1]